MVSPSLDFSVYTDGSLKWQLAPAPAPAVQLYRQPHDKELRLATVKADPTSTDRVYRGSATGTARSPERTKTIPEVYQLLPDFGVTTLSPAWCDLICALNYPIKRELAELIYTDPHWAFNNVGGKPMWDKPRICGGAILKGEVNGSNLMIESLLTSQQVPSVDYILSRPWLWFYGTQVNPDGVVTYMTLGLGDGIREPIKLPLLFAKPVYLPLSWLHKLPPGTDPEEHDPRRMW